ncbi:hypothetical protein Pint_33925 [Pistacia integerrima]|uniref:Uncharacterized protein n=1 Tax=Pistacia integerrima TaxID=434235 RepID=A0ACC0X5Z5_9ROSI|nr:hypothetical protein Pint_33925 [Pistacia integerrima]
MESICGPRRYLAVYFSAIASSAMSYWFSKLPAVGASGAICGSVGSLAVFVTRHRDISGHGREDLQHIAQTIGLLYKGIDNWGHVSISLFLSLCVYVKFLPYKYENELVLVNVLEGACLVELQCHGFLVGFSLEIRLGHDPKIKICNEAKRVNPDLLVMGTTPKLGFLGVM